MRPTDTHSLDATDAELVAAIPDYFRLLATSIPRRQLLAFFEKFGGFRIYVPKEPAEGSPFSQVLDRRSFSALTKIFGGENVDIPRALALRKILRDREILRLLASGQTTREIGRQVGLGQRRVFQVLRELRAGDSTPGRKGQ
jgi:hypothetical protein